MYSNPGGTVMKEILLRLEALVQEFKQRTLDLHEFPQLLKELQLAVEKEYGTVCNVTFKSFPGYIMVAVNLTSKFPGAVYRFSYK
jgi:hypothetical protein